MRPSGAIDLLAPVEWRALWLPRGAVEFWIVDAKTATVAVYSKTSGVRIYSAPMAVPVPILGDRIQLELLFAPL